MRWVALAGLICIVVGVIGVAVEWLLIDHDRGPDWLLVVLGPGGVACAAVGLAAILVTAVVVALG